MADGAERSRWARASWIMALIANANRDPKRRPRPFSPAEFDPYEIARRKERGPEGPALGLEDLKRVVQSGRFPARGRRRRRERKGNTP